MNLVNQLHPTSARPNFHVQSQVCTVSEVSIFSAMERFVSAVDKMDKIVMIPCKLMDMSVEKDDYNVPRSISSESDLHSIYQMLLSLRNELRCGFTNESSVLTVDCLQPRRKSAPLTKMNVHANRKRTNKPVRFSASSLSLSSLESVSSDISEYDTDSDSGKQSDDCDTPIESPTQPPHLSSKTAPHVSLADTFRMHLTGLYSTLDELTSSADYLSNRYQSEDGFW